VDISAAIAAPANVIIEAHFKKKFQKEKEKNQMKKYVFAMLSMALLPACAFAVDGQVLINQSIVTALGGFPYAITQPGSYKLSSGLLVPPGVSAIQINTPNVTLDLNGFTINGQNQNGITGGISFAADASFVTILNGQIINFGYPISTATTPQHWTLKDLQVTGIGPVYISVGGYSLIWHVTGQVNLEVTCPSVVTESVAPEIFPNNNGVGNCVFANNAEIPGN
jgi:hypothetical protein